ncbi:leucine-rich repeat-containing protein kinase family protein [Zoogloea sp.]|uniref:leucine-rich repeat-containing protein kinase family protein n=1 Tax=Zoogloea sp. TaxID=49181 RepID=UPI0025CD27A2|nr:leucine-rich repeat-containing protein kinase family protein [Zoogloea sp.]MCK6392796.1 leucine-rich repeat-containing serine/threonine-protein kinase [Zoogloea sp.]
MNTLDELRAGRLHGARELRLSFGLTNFPEEIFELADSLEVLDLSGNQLESLPDMLPRLHRLRVLFCSGNPFRVLPEVLGRCPQLEMVGFKSCRIESVPAEALPPRLRWLILTDNRIGRLPAAIGRCGRLQKLMLAGNLLDTLPAELARCTRLELLRIAANRLVALPGWLLKMPRLSWLAYAGNPFCLGLEVDRKARIRVPDVSWGGLEMERVLGEGASGVIHQARWGADGAGRDVAVKCFKGAVTSDGLPGNEMAVCLDSGRHPGLIPVLGRLGDHPEGVAGLVMERIDPAFRTLAGPPSRASCTRDVYAPDQCLPARAVLRLAADMAGAAAHLHARHILHGDLYAHNILYRPDDGRALLGDFGAASFIPPDDPELAEALQRLEVRAFGCLLEELVEHCDGSDPSGTITPALVTLRDRCLQPDPAARPRFAELVEALQAVGDAP